MSLLLLLLSLALTYFSPAEIAPEWAKYHLQEFILLPAMGASLVAMSAARSRVQMPQYLLMIAIWFAVVMSQLTNLWFGGALKVFLSFGIVVCLYFVVSLNSSSVLRIRVIAGMLITCALVMAVQGMMAYYGGYRADKLIYRDRIVAFGILNDSNDLAQFFLVALALLGVFWKRGSMIRNVVLVPFGVTLIYGIYLTFSRGAAIGLVVLLFIAVSSRLPKIVSVTLAGLALLVLMAAGFGGGRDISIHEASAAGRVIAWGSGIGFLRSHPIFGIGFSQFADLNGLTAHNSFVLCFAELGLFGYFFWLAFVTVTVMGLERLNKIKTLEPDFRGVLAGLRAAFYGFLATSWFLSRTYTPTLYILFAVCGSLIHMHDNAAAVTVPARPALPIPWVRRTVQCGVLSIIVVYISIKFRTI